MSEKAWTEEWWVRNSVACVDDVYARGVGRIFWSDGSGNDGECGAPRYEEWAARARLAAAAPDLARALERLASWVNFDALPTFEGDPMRSELEGKRAFVQAADALKKAGLWK